MFGFVIRYLGFLKVVPGLALLFEQWLRVYTLFTHPDMLDWIDDIEAEMLKLEYVTSTMHKYGGIQFNYKGKEMGHIHGNGLLDMLLCRKVKQQLMMGGRIRDHHSFKNTGWISFYMHTNDDADYAAQLLRNVYKVASAKK